MTKKIFRAIVLAATAVLLTGMAVAAGCLYTYFTNLQTQQLTDEAHLAATIVEEGHAEKLSDISFTSPYRFTWIAADGSVLYDSLYNAADLENHGQREEFVQARETGQGEIIRYSNTLLEKTHYHAVLLNDGSVLRVSLSQQTGGRLLLGLLPFAIMIFLGALLLSAALARRLSLNIVEPLNSLNLESPLQNDTYDELTPLLTRMNDQHKEIDEQVHLLKRRTDEFDHITESLKEALVLLDKHDKIIAINPAAFKLFETDKTCKGRHLVEIDRTPALNKALTRAKDHGHAEFSGVRNERSYQFDVSRVQSEGKIVGSVLLAFDITEREQTEQMRREFTANVSHELKTPLQGIIGSAELIERGMVSESEVPRFINHIRTEAERLRSLVADILQLAQLDEGATLPTESIELTALCKGVAHKLGPLASNHAVSIQVVGDTIPVQGCKALIEEAVYNLCNNAILYNKKNGEVTIEVKADAEEATICVKDTGIGIAPADQQRIFERFYRVDKSHSKDSGGTGLGLAIVKHATLYHQGHLTVKSEVGKGSEITITLPRSFAGKSE